MKKDIFFPEVKEVYVAVVNERNTDFNTDDWNAYIINNSDADLDLVLIVSKGYSETKKTAVFRKKIDKLPKKSYAKLEWLQEAVLELNNEFKVSFFKGQTMFDKTYLFQKNTINLKACKTIPLLNKKGVLVS